MIIIARFVGRFGFLRSHTTRTGGLFKRSPFDKPTDSDPKALSPPDFSIIK